MPRPAADPSAARPRRTKPPAPPAVEREAAFDASGRYRYALTRRWAPGGAQVTFVLLNPSTADATRDDPTIRRCMGFARAWDHTALEVVNLFAWRATRPAELRRAPAPVGEENDTYLLRAVRRAARVVLAWGIHGALAGRDAAVCELLRRAGVQAECLGVTQAGQPRHVLYLPRDAQPLPFPPLGQANGKREGAGACAHPAAPFGT